MKHLLFAVFLAVFSTLAGAQHVVADPWAPTLADQPDGVAYRIGTGTPTTCLLKPVVGGAQMDCDYSALPTGVHQTIITLTKTPVCTNPIPGVEGQCTSWTALDVPFRYTVAKKPVAAPANLRLSGP